MSNSELGAEYLRDNYDFATMPLGTGNDLSRGFSLGSKMGFFKIDKFMRIILQKKVIVRAFDIWEIEMKNWLPQNFPNKLMSKIKTHKLKNFKKALVLYMGIGYDAHIVYYFEQFRKKFPLLMVSQKISRLYFAVIFFVLAFRTCFKRHLKTLYKVFQLSVKRSGLRKKSFKRRFKEDITQSEEEEDPDEVVHLGSINNAIIMNNRFRAGGNKNEWKNSKRAIVKNGDRTDLYRKKKSSRWVYERSLYRGDKGWVSYFEYNGVIWDNRGRLI